MNRQLLTRLALDFLAAGLLLIALAYEWLGNTLHEIVGTSMFALALVHNVLNRRWYGNLNKGRKEARRTITTTLNLSLVFAMITLLVTSVLISRTVFAFLSLDGGLIVRQIHTLAAYWGLVIVSLHLGMHWTMIMSAARSVAGLRSPNPVRTALLRIATTAIAVGGIQSSFEMSIGSKLVMYFSFSFWDFETAWVGFFVRYASIVGLYAAIAHYCMVWLQARRKRLNAPRPRAVSAAE